MKSSVVLSNMTETLSSIIYSIVPKKIEKKKLSQLLHQSDLNQIDEESEQLLYYTGIEYSEYIEKSYSSKKNGKDIFKEHGRYVDRLDEMDFFLRKDAGFAASSNLPAHINFFSGMEIWDIRSFIGKKNSSSCLHFDWNSCPILLVNSYGTKKFEIYPPSVSSTLKGYGNFTFNSTSSNQNLFEINEGEAIVIPPFWWHRAHYITNAKSFSIRFLPSKNNAFIIKNFYPSWKFLQLFSQSNSAQYDFIGLLESTSNRALSSQALFEETEQILNEKIEYTEKDHPHYSRFILDYLDHYRFNNP